ncbi:MAG: DUF4288 domain-containing protein [Cyclobacteriaceae bacterium]|nr:DUF4288 domain-containing protein [Cyclobacteriaceae bacterium]
MNWYITKIVFGIHAENQTQQQFDEQLRLVCAENQEEAFLKSRIIGLGEEDAFFNDKNHLVKWEFINVAEVIPLQKLEDGVELYSRIHELKEAKTYITFIHQRARSLRLHSEMAY